MPSVLYSVKAMAMATTSWIFSKSYNLQLLISQLDKEERGFLQTVLDQVSEPQPNARGEWEPIRLHRS
jgi:hypothetical protein